jgi:hypothetical protein
MRLADLDEEQSREKRQAVAFAGAEKAGGFRPSFARDAWPRFYSGICELSRRDAKPLLISKSFARDARRRHGGKCHWRPKRLGARHAHFSLHRYILKERACDGHFSKSATARNAENALGVRIDSGRNP